MGKFTVSNFVKAMTGAKVAVMGNAREKAEADFAILLDCQMQLSNLNVSSGKLDAAIATYRTSLTAADAATDKGTKVALFDALAAETKRVVKETLGPFKSWKKLAQRQTTLVMGINEAFGAQLDQIATIKTEKIKTILNARLRPLQKQAVFADDADALSKHLTTLEALRATISETDVGRHVTASETFLAERDKLRQSLSGFEASVGALQPSALKTLMDSHLKSFQDKAKILGKDPEDLFGLVYKSQDLTDLNETITGFDIAGLKALIDRYQTAETSFSTKLSQVQQVAANLPASPATTEVQKNIAACAAKLIPTSQIGDPAKLESVLADLPSLETELESLELETSAIRQFADNLAELFTTYDQKNAETKALESGAIRDAMKTSLTALLNTATPLAEVKSAKDEIGTQRKTLESFKAFDVAKYLSLAKTYQDQWGEWLFLFNQKTKEVAAVSDPDAKAALKNILTGFESQTKLLSEILTLKELEDCRTKLADLDGKLRALDLAAAAAEALEKQKALDALIQEHKKELAALNASIDAKIKEATSSQGAGAANALLADFRAGFDKFDTLTPQENPTQKIAAIKQRAQRVAEHKIVVDVESQKRLEKSDKRAAGTQSQIDGLTDPELQKKAQAALDNMKAKLDQLRAGLDAGGLGREMAVGDPKQGGLMEVRLNGKEQMRAMDAAIKALSDSLKDPTGIKMLEFEGGNSFAEGIAKMYGTQVAFGASHKGISPAEALSIQRYTGADYSAMNRNRRGVEDDDRLDFLNKTCDVALAKMPPYPPTAWPAYRFETAWSQDVVDKRYANGRQFTCGVLWSTGARGSAAISPQSSPSINHVIYGSKGRDVAALSANSGEGAASRGNEFNPASGRGEVLFPADSAFVVKGRVDKPAPDMEKLVYLGSPYRGEMDTNLKEASNG